MANASDATVQAKKLLLEAQLLHKWGNIFKDVGLNNHAAEKAEGGEALVSGVKMTLNTLMESLKRFGFEEVPALGEEFDPELHNAVMREAGDEPGRILEVFQKGYRVKDKIIRYAMVKVAVEE